MDDITKWRLLYYFETELNLSQAEFFYYKYIEGKLKNKDIAEKVKIARRTVGTYRTQINNDFRKMGLSPEDPEVHHIFRIIAPGVPPYGVWPPEGYTSRIPPYILAQIRDSEEKDTGRPFGLEPRHQEVVKQPDQEEVTEQPRQEIEESEEPDQGFSPRTIILAAILSALCIIALVIGGVFLVRTIDCDVIAPVLGMECPEEIVPTETVMAQVVPSEPVVDLPATAAAEATAIIETATAEVVVIPEPEEPQQEPEEEPPQEPEVIPPTDTLTPTNTPTPTGTPTLSPDIIAPDKLPQTWSGTRTKLQPQVDTFQMVISLEEMTRNNIKGQINYPDINNTVTVLEGELVEDFGDLAEQSKWNYVEGYGSDTDGMWFKFTEPERIQGFGIPLDVVHYVHVTDDGVMKGVVFPRYGSVPGHEYELFLES